MASAIQAPLKRIMNKKTEVVVFSSTAIALYGYDQGMMSLINTNFSYLHTLSIRQEDPLVGAIVSVYYLGCTLGAVLASYAADRRGRKFSILLCLLTASLGNAIMFITGMGMAPGKGPLLVMLLGRVIMGIGVGGIDAVVPVYSSELSDDEARGKALAQEFQANIFGLLIAFALNLALTISLGKTNQWAWRLPIIGMQIFPLVLLAMIFSLPETPRHLISKGKKDRAKKALKMLYSEKDAKEKLDELESAIKDEENSKVGYPDMIIPGKSQFHPTYITVMGQVNQALTGYGAVSVYGPQIFELLGFRVRTAEYLTLGNYLSYFLLMTLAWLWIDKYGRRTLMLGGAFAMSISFFLLTLFGGLAMNSTSLHIPNIAVAIPGAVILYLATGAFGIGWLATPWLIPTEIYPSSARAKGAAISVIIWGIANFAVTLLTPIGFNNLKYWLFLVFAVTNEIAGWWTWAYSPETGSRSFEDNQEFFKTAEEEGSWQVRKVDGGIYRSLPSDQEEKGDENDVENERSPLLRRND